MKFTPKSLLCSALGLAGVWLFLVLVFSLHGQEPKPMDHPGLDPGIIGGNGTTTINPIKEPKRLGKACVYYLSDGRYELAKPPCDYDPKPAKPIKSGQTPTPVWKQLSGNLGVDECPKGWEVHYQNLGPGPDFEPPFCVKAKP